jgi:predicted negative regulator of RcsB-dependent stress response
MAYDLEEQEQIASLKAFWNQYGNFILTAVTIVLLAIAGWRGWNWYQGRQSGEAAVVYEQLREAVDARDVAKVKDSAGTIFEKYGKTVYGEMAAMLAAKAYHEAGDDKSAKAPLQWAVDNARDEEFKHLARVKLAGILLDEKAYDQALALLPMESAGKFAGDYADRRGDILLAQGKRDEARASYKLALDKLGEASALRRLVQLKLDGLGGAAS